METVSGAVTATGISATSCRLVSSSGNLILEGCRGLLQARTISGEIIARRVQEAVLALESSSGDVTFSGSLSSEGEHRVETISDVRLVLPSNAAFDLDIETVSGAIQTAFAVTTTGFDKDHIAGKVNDGGPPLRINTSSGNITLERTSTKRANRQPAITRESRQALAPRGWARYPAMATPLAWCA